MTARMCETRLRWYVLIFLKCDLSSNQSSLLLQAFRPGQVDLPAEQLIANKNAITYTERRNEYDIMMSDLNMNMSWNEIAKNFQPLGLHLANEANITLPRAHYAASARSSSISRESEYGSQRGRAGTTDPFEEGIDLGLNLGDDLADLGDISVEFGREAGVERAPSVASGMRIGDRASSVLTDHTARSATAELGGSVLGAGELLAASRGDLELELEAPGDLGLDLGEGFDLPPLEDDVQMDVDMSGVQGLEGVAEEEAEIQARARRECEYLQNISSHLRLISCSCSRVSYRSIAATARVPRINHGGHYSSYGQQNRSSG